MSVVSFLFILVVILALAITPPLVIPLISRGRLPVGYLIPLAIGVIVVILFLVVIMAFVLSLLSRPVRAGLGHWEGKIAATGRERATLLAPVGPSLDRVLRRRSNSTSRRSSIEVRSKGARFLW